MGQRTAARKQKPKDTTARVSRNDAAGLSAEALNALRRLGARLDGTEILRLQAASRLLVCREQGVQKDAATLLGGEPWAEYLRGVLGVGHLERRSPYELAGWLSVGRDTTELREALVGQGRPREIEKLEESIKGLCDLDAGSLMGSSFGAAMRLASFCSVQSLMLVLDSCHGVAPSSTNAIEEALQSICSVAARAEPAYRDELAVRWGKYRQSVKKRGTDQLVYESVRVADRLLTTSMLIGRPSSSGIGEHPFPLTVATSRLLASAEVMDVSELPDPAHVTPRVELDVTRWWRELTVLLPHELDARDSEGVTAVTTAAWVTWLLGDFETAFRIAGMLHIEMHVALPGVFALLPFDAALLVSDERERAGFITLGVSQLLGGRTLPWKSVAERMQNLLGSTPAPYWPFRGERAGSSRTQDRAVRLVEQALSEGAKASEMMGLVVAEYEARGAAPATAVRVEAVERTGEVPAESASSRAPAEFSTGPTDLDAVEEVLEWLSRAGTEADRASYAAWCLSEEGRGVLGDVGVLAQLRDVREHIDLDTLRGEVQRSLWSCVGTHRFSAAIEASRDLHVLSEDEISSVEAEHTARTRTVAIAAAVAEGAPVRVVFVGGNETQAAYVPHIEETLRETYGGRVSITWVDQTWGSNWHVVADRVDRLLVEADVVCLMTFVRTALGGRVRKLSKSHGVPWVAVTGHGRAALLGSIHEAVGVVDRLRERASQS
jgi:hypothetical protein